MPFFICPHCGHREVHGSRTEGFSRRPKGCSKCGFGFVFELLDDYYPAPSAAFFVCDQQERVIDAGKGSYELTGLTDEDVIGRPVREVLGLDWIDQGDGGPTADTDGDGKTDPIETSLEWGVRSLGKRVSVNAEGDLPAKAVADVFPAYDDDGGLLLVLGLVALSGIIIATKETKLGLDLQGGLQLVYEGQPTGTSTEVSGEDIEDSINIIEKRINNLGVSEAEVARLGEKNITVGLPGVTDANRAAEQVGTTAQLFFFDWEPNLIGQERTIGGHPGQQPPGAAVKKLEKEWKAAGRNPESIENGSLIAAGAFPNAYSAALLAAEQEPNEECENCSSGKTQYYLFEKE